MGGIPTSSTAVMVVVRGGISVETSALAVRGFTSLCLLLYCGLFENTFQIRWSLCSKITLQKMSTLPVENKLAPDFLETCFYG